MYLDDEIDNLTSFKASFRREWNILTAINHTEAFQILSDNEVQIVVSDQRMPEKTGVEFLTEVRNKFPDCVRILLTGHADLESVIDAINESGIYRYFTKPWNDQVLHEAFTHCAEIYIQRKELKQKDEDLLKSYKELESFVYSASHDLRAPLVSILGVVKLAKIQKAQGIEPVDYLHHIEHAVQNLDKFVKNIINYYQNRKQTIQCAEVDLDLLLDEVFLTFKHFDGAENIKLSKNIEKSAPLYSDELRLKIILNNLISNALKYHDSTKKEQWIKVDAEITEDEFSIEIKDNGKGIAKDQVEKVFDMFFTGTNGKSLGTGIGLHIVSEAIEKIGGTISLTSDKEIGTSFLVKGKNGKSRN